MFLNFPPYRLKKPLTRRRPKVPRRHRALREPDRGNGVHCSPAEDLGQACADPLLRPPATAKQTPPKPSPFPALNQQTTLIVWPQFLCRLFSFRHSTRTSTFNRQYWKTQRPNRVIAFRLSCNIFIHSTGDRASWQLDVDNVVGLSSLFYRCVRKRNTRSAWKSNVDGKVRRPLDPSKVGRSFCRCKLLLSVASLELHPLSSSLSPFLFGISVVS